MYQICWWLIITPNIYRLSWIYINTAVKLKQPSGCPKSKKATSITEWLLIYPAPLSVPHQKLMSLLSFKIKNFHKNKKETKVSFFVYI
ncbi:hypothetical protein [Flavobacterium branchiicola]|uniref:hypothetical protein n=1 Tax=Flavobacterium branchiicola TaxID=1114875 RepID=UPI0036D2FB15